MKYLPTSLYLTCRPFSGPVQWGEVYSYKGFRNPRCDDQIRDPAPGRRGGVQGGGVKCRDSADIADIVPLEAHECTCGGRGGRAQMPGYFYVLLRWSCGASGGKGIEGLANVKGNTVGIGRK